MLGKLDPSKKKVHVIGAGIAGLLVSYRLIQKGYQVELWEATDRVGGKLGTKTTQYGLSEQAAHSLLASPAVLQLCQELDLPLLRVYSSSRARWIQRDGKWKRWPLSFLETFTLFKCLIFARAGFEESDWTLQQWGEKYLGSAGLDYLLDPFLTGIYGAQPSELLQKVVFPHFDLDFGQTLFNKWWRGKRKKTKMNKGKGGMVSFERGLGQLADALFDKLNQSTSFDINFKQPVQDLSKIMQEHNVVVCTEADIAARLLESLNATLGSRLKKIEYSSLVTATCFIQKNAFKKVPYGVGVLLSSNERDRLKTPLLGVLFNSATFLGRVKDNHVFSCTVLIKGDRLSQDELLVEVKKVLSLQHWASFLQTEVTVWEKALPRCNKAIQQLLEDAPTILNQKPGLVLFGNYTGDISLRGMIESSLTLD